MSHTIKTNIKGNDNNISMMKKILILISIMLLFIGTGYSATLVEDDQEVALEDYSLSSYLGLVGNELLEVNETTTADISITTSSMFLTISAIDSDQNITIGYFDETLSATLSKNYTVTTGELFIYEVYPTGTSNDVVLDSKFTLVISSNTGSILYNYVFTNDNQRGISEQETIFSPLITASMDLIEININIWRIGYYLFITMIILIVIGGLFWTGFQIYEFSKKLDKRGMHK